MTMEKFKRTTALAAVGLVGVATGFLFGGTASEATDTANAASVTGCAIRFTENGPAIHENATHSCTGAEPVRVVNGDLEIKQKRGGPIVSVTVEEDETLSTRGIIGGPSGGTGTTIVRFFATRSNVPVDADSPALQGATSNIWLTWVHAG